MISPVPQNLQAPPLGSSDVKNIIVTIVAVIVLGILLIAGVLLIILSKYSISFSKSSVCVSVGILCRKKLLYRSLASGQCL